MDAAKGSVLDIDLDTRVDDLLSAFAAVMEAMGEDTYPAAVKAFRAAGERLTDGISAVARLRRLPFAGPHGWGVEQTAAFVSAMVGASMHLGGSSGPESEPE